MTRDGSNDGAKLTTTAAAAAGRGALLGESTATDDFETKLQAKFGKHETLKKLSCESQVLHTQKIFLE